MPSNREQLTQHLKRDDSKALLAAIGEEDDEESLRRAVAARFQKRVAQLLEEGEVKDAGPEMA